MAAAVRFAALCVAVAVFWLACNVGAGALIGALT